MKEHNNRGEYLESLFSLLIDGQCTAAQWEELVDALRDDAQAQAAYLEFMALHGQLIWRHGPAAATGTVSAPPAASKTEAKPKAASPPKRARRDQAPPRPAARGASQTKPAASADGLNREGRSTARRRDPLAQQWSRLRLPAAPPKAVALALTAAVVLGIAVWWSWRPGASATLTKTLQATWEPDAAAAQSELLASGRQLKLKQGWAEITFHSGAKVTLQAPAALTITNSNAARLEAGQLAADVPPAATGFTLEVPSGKIVDRGTQFGVIVDKVGGGQEETVEVHVLKGRVDMETGGQGGGGLTVTQLAANEAVRSSTANLAVQRIPAEPDRFVTSINEPIVFQPGDIVVNGPAQTLCRLSDGAIFASNVYPSNKIVSVAFNADGTALYAIEKRWKGSIGPVSQLTRIDMTHSESPQVVGRFRWGTSLVAAPDGMVLVCDAQPRHTGPQIIAFDPANNYRQSTVVVLPAECRGLVASPAGDIYVAVANHFVAQLDRSSGALIPVIEDIDPSGLLLHPTTGEILVGVSPAAGGMEIRRYAVTGQQSKLRETLTLAEKATLYGVAADGLILATPQRGAGLWQIDPRTGQRTVISTRAVNVLAIYQPEL